MYGRQTESWWQQLTGEEITGEFTGKQLSRLPAQIMSFANFITNHPQGEILSRETGYQRAYRSNPYRGYDSVDDQPFDMALSPSSL